MKKLLTRTITGSIYVAIIVIPLLISSSAPFMGVFVLFTILGINEFHNLVSDKNEKKSTSSLFKAIDIIGGAALFTGLYLSYATSTPNLWMIPTLTYLVVRLIAQLYTKHSTNPLHDAAMSIMSIIYVALPISLLNNIYFDYGSHILLAVFILIWVNDTGAFCVGSLIGKHRLFERISPKKSWEGFWGGLLFCVVASIIFFYFNDFFNGPSSLPVWIGFGIIVSVFATWGDLCESLIKRTLGVKDSGNLLPGHGGILDRVDSLLLVSPAILIYLLATSFLSNI